jgi:hypothetical protein
MLVKGAGMVAAQTPAAAIAASHIGGRRKLVYISVSLKYGTTCLEPAYVASFQCDATLVRRSHEIAVIHGGSVRTYHALDVRLGIILVVVALELAYHLTQTHDFACLAVINYYIPALF